MSISDLLALRTDWRCGTCGRQAGRTAYYDEPSLKTFIVVSCHGSVFQVEVPYLIRSKSDADATIRIIEGIKIFERQPLFNRPPISGLQQLDEIIQNLSESKMLPEWSDPPFSALPDFRPFAYQFVRPDPNSYLRGRRFPCYACGGAAMAEVLDSPQEGRTYARFLCHGEEEEIMLSCNPSEAGRIIGCITPFYTRRNTQGQPTREPAKPQEYLESRPRAIHLEG